MPELMASAAAHPLLTVLTVVVVPYAVHVIRWSIWAWR